MIDPIGPRLATVGLMTAFAVGPSHALPQSVDLGPEERVAADTLPDWLAGYWEGDGFGGTVEELWTPPRAGTMVGTFRLTIGGQVQLVEFMTLTLTGLHPVLRVKHFNSDGSAWENRDEWVEFPFERLGRGAIYFSGLSYEVVDRVTLRVLVAVGHADGSSEIEELVLRRIS